MHQIMLEPQSNCGSILVGYLDNQVPLDNKLPLTPLEPNISPTPPAYDLIRCTLPNIACMLCVAVIQPSWHT